VTTNGWATVGLPAVDLHLKCPLIASPAPADRVCGPCTWQLKGRVGPKAAYRGSRRSTSLAALGEVFGLF